MNEEAGLKMHIINFKYDTYHILYGPSSYDLLQEDGGQLTLLFILKNKMTNIHY